MVHQLQDPHLLKSFQFNYITFFIGFVVGLIFIYFKEPELQEKVVYPTPLNAGNITYNNGNGECFQYTAIRVKCPEDTTLIRHHNVDNGLENDTSGSTNPLTKLTNLFN